MAIIFSPQSTEGLPAANSLAGETATRLVHASSDGVIDKVQLSSDNRSFERTNQQSEYIVTKGLSSYLGG